jgi:hypothetical protein
MSRPQCITKCILQVCTISAYGSGWWSVWNVLDMLRYILQVRVACCVRLLSCNVRPTIEHRLPPPSKWLSLYLSHVLGSITQACVVVLSLTPFFLSDNCHGG